MLTFQTLQRRAALIRAIRCFFLDRDFLEVDTPARTPAPAPEACIEPIPAGSWYLQTSPELYMKQLLAGGCPRIFQICGCFRQGERGERHLEEFTMLEWYRSESSYQDLMADCESLLNFLARECASFPGITGRGSALLVGGQRIELSPPWERLTVARAFARYTTSAPVEALASDRFDEILCQEIEPRLGHGRPCLLHDYPAELGSLARLKSSDPGVAERFELYINGLELANGFSELTDPGEQRRRFELEREKIRAQGREPGPMPERFLVALQDMPESAGIALGVDRLLMLLLDTGRIDDVVTFVPEEL
ncbi:MAG: EF-P lysine aminoacylase GenX [Desulfobacterales bacterium]|nr:EF-P lysine aminoacylase GenX [Desulfobacterales bacterium]